MTARIGIISACDFPQQLLLDFLAHLDALGIECRLEVCSPTHGVSIDLVQSWHLGGVEVFVTAGGTDQLPAAVGMLTTAPIVRLGGGSTTQNVDEAIELCLRIVGMRHSDYTDKVGALAERICQTMETRRQQLLWKLHEQRQSRQPPHRRDETQESWFTPALRGMLTAAHGIAVAYRHGPVTPEHILAAAIDTAPCAAHSVLLKGRMSLRQLACHIESAFPPKAARASSEFALSPEAATLMELAKELARQAGHLSLGTWHLLKAAALMPETKAAAILQETGLTADTMDRIMASGGIHEETCARTASDKLLHGVREMQKRLFGQHDAEERGMDMGCSSQADTSVRRKPDVKAEGKQTRRKSRPDKGTSTAARRKSPAATGTPGPVIEVIELAGDATAGQPSGNVVQCDSLAPQLSILEMAADRLLEGRLVAFPTDTVYGVGGDATNAHAVERLYEIKGRPPSKAIAVLIHSVKQLRHVVRNMPDEVPGLLERFWPGPLTVVFERHSACLAHVSSDATIGVRIPDHYLALSLLSMIGRPLATSSANITGQPDSLTAGDVASHFGRSIDLILDGGEAPGKVTSTVLSVVQRPFRVLREGAISKSVLEAALDCQLL